MVIATEEAAGRWMAQAKQPWSTSNYRLALMLE